MTRRLEGKVALVTGAGASGPGWGNGKAAAVLFAREGAKVFCADIDLAAAQETVEIIRGEGGQALAHEADVSDGAAVEALVAACSCSTTTSASPAWGDLRSCRKAIGTGSWRSTSSPCFSPASSPCR